MVSPTSFNMKEFRALLASASLDEIVDLIDYAYHEIDTRDRDLHGDFDDTSTEDQSVADTDLTEPSLFENVPPDKRGRVTAPPKIGAAMQEIRMYFEQYGNLNDSPYFLSHDCDGMTHVYKDIRTITPKDWCNDPEKLLFVDSSFLDNSLSVQSRVPLEKGTPSPLSQAQGDVGCDIRSLPNRFGPLEDQTSTQKFEKISDSKRYETLMDKLFITNNFQLTYDTGQAHPAIGFRQCGFSDKLLYQSKGGGITDRHLENPNIGIGRISYLGPGRHRSEMATGQLLFLIGSVSTESIGFFKHRKKKLSFTSNRKRKAQYYSYMYEKYNSGNLRYFRIHRSNESIAHLYHKFRKENV